MSDTIAFIHRLAFEDLPADVVRQAKRCLLDLVGVAAGGRQTQLSDIACSFAARFLKADGHGARIMFDGRRASPMGAAFAGAATIDALDAHDGHPLTKGHAGAALLPALLAMFDTERREPNDGDGCDFLACLVLGYEIAIRAGIALHASAPDYHTSGAWNALGCAAIAARVLRLSEKQTREALGIAEYNGPRSQMMRCIDHPTMVKDGSGWGAFAGVAAAYLAADGFTGAPALTMEQPAHAGLWGDLGRRWRILEQYFKPEPICRWAQPATEAARQLREQYNISPDAIKAIQIETFHAAVRLGTHMPTTTEEAQYAIGFPVAAMFARGHVSVAEIAGAGLEDETIRGLTDKIELTESDEYSRRFPSERIAIVSVELADGRILTSPPTAPRGGIERPLSQNDIETKFRTLAGDLSINRQNDILGAIPSLDSDAQQLKRLISAIY
jgi:2-methylcitrate dehydratase PrpD